MKHLSWKVVPNSRELVQEREWHYQSCGPAIRQSWPPSGTLRQTVQEMLLDPRSFYEKHSLVVNGHTEDALRQLARLYSWTSYDLPESFLCKIPKGYVTDHGTIATDTREILTEFHLENWSRARFYFMFSMKHNPVFLPGQWFSLVTFYAKNYAHWLMDLLPVTALLDHVEGDCSLLIPSVKTSFQQESIRLLGLVRFPLREVEPLMQVESLILPFSAAISGTPRQDHLLSLQKRLWQAVGASPRLQTRIYVSRAGSLRSIINEAELEPILKKQGFITVHPEKMSLTEQILLFSQAEIIVGPHGAGMMNQLFAPAGAEIIEIFNPGFWHENNARITSLLDQRHWHLFGKNMNAAYDTFVEVKPFRKLLELVLEIRAN